MPCIVLLYAKNRTLLYTEAVFDFWDALRLLTKLPEGCAYATIQETGSSRVICASREIS